MGNWRQVIVASITFTVLIYGTCVGAPASSADTLRHCDSATTALLLQQILGVNDSNPRSRRVDISMSGKAVPTTLYLDREGRWHEPVFRMKRTCWGLTDDSVTIAVHSLVDVDRYLRGADHRYKGTVANLVGGVNSNSSQTSEIVLDASMFPGDAGLNGTFGGHLRDVGFIYLGTSRCPVLYADMVGEDSDYDTWSKDWSNRRMWFSCGAGFVPLRYLELSRGESEMDVVDRKDLETSIQVEDVDHDGVCELVYSRRYIIARNGKQTEFSDPGGIVFKFHELYPRPYKPSSSIGNVTGIAPRKGDDTTTPGNLPGTLTPTHFMSHDRTLIPIRPNLPILLFPGERVFGEQDTIIRGEGWTRYPSPSEGGGHIVHLGRNQLQAYYEGGAERPSLSLGLCGDSVEFKIVNYGKEHTPSTSISCPGDSFVVALWIDTDLQKNFTSPSCSADDYAFLVRIHPGDSTVSIERCSITENQGDLTLTQLSRRNGTLVCSGRGAPDILRFRIPRDEMGLVEHPGFPVMCGFAAEAVCGATNFWRWWPGGIATYPVGLDHSDPRTWGTIMIADRKDTVFTHEH